MLNRWSILTLVLGILAGYAAGSRPVGAQESASVVKSGERVNFLNEDGRIMGSCTIGAVVSDYVGCTREGARPDEVQEWWRLDRIVQIQKLPPR